MKTKQVERLNLGAENLSRGKATGAGAGGLSSVGAALAAAGAGDLVLPVQPVEDGAGGVEPRAAGVEAMTIAQALSSCERAAGPLLRECQGQADLALSDSCARKLAGRMRGAGATVSAADVEDATGAGCLALQVWRTTGAGADGAERLAARVAWRGAVVCMSSDRFGESSVSFETVTDGDLWAAAEFTSESRAERAARLRVERAARGAVLVEPIRLAVGFADGRLTETGGARFQILNLPAGTKVTSRQARLAARMARLPVGRGPRAAVIERVTNCAALLLDGFRLDEAASAAGFNPCGQGRGRHTAADMFARACARLGFSGWQLSARQSDSARAARRAAIPGAGVVDGEQVGAEFVPYVERGAVEFVPLAAAVRWAQPASEPRADVSPLDFIGPRVPVGALSSERGAAWRGWLAARRLARANGRALARALARFDGERRAAIRRAAAGDGAAGKAAARAIRRARRELLTIPAADVVGAGE